MKIKHLKAKLMAAILSLVLAVAMMGSATFAWMTISTNPEIKGMTATVVVNENLEIAYAGSATVPGASAIGDAMKADTYGNLVAYTTSVDPAMTNQAKDGENFCVDFAALNKTLRPAALCATANTIGTQAVTSASVGTFYCPIYDDDGRITSVEALVATPTANTGVGNLKGTTDGKIYGYFVDFWVRTNVEGFLQISGAAKRSSAETATDGTGSNFTATTLSGDQDKTLAANIGVAYVLQTSKEGLDTAAATAIAGTASENVKTFTAGTQLGSAKLTPNTDYVLRIYVYLNGEGVTNADASINGITVDGTLNLQFKNSAITTGSMDNQS